MQLRIWIITILLVAGLAACAPEVIPTPLPTLETELAEPGPVTVERIAPTLTVTSIPTDNPPSTSTSIPTPLTQTPSEALSVPRRTATPLGPTPKPTPLPLQLQKNIEVVMIVDDVEYLFWSPTNHEFVQVSCPREKDHSIQFVNVTDLTRKNITPVPIICWFASILWHPSGEYFLLSSEVNQQDGYEIGALYGWEVSRDTLTFTDLEWGESYWGWFDNNTYVSEIRVGTGINSIGLYDHLLGENVSGSAFEGKVKGISNNFVVLNEELATSYNTSTAILAQELISPEFERLSFGPYIKFAGKKDDRTGWEWDRSFYSRFADVFPNTDQVLIVTWDEPISIDGDYQELLSGVVQTNLQLWDAQTDEVSMVLPNGIYGRFSPDGSIMAAMIQDMPHPNLQLLSYPNNEKYLSIPAYAESSSFGDGIIGFTTFSPNGRYFTFFTPETDLVVYDIQTGEMLPPITAVPAEPLWSPDNTRFVYSDPARGLSIYDIRSHTTYPLAETGSERLSNPQWSYDGAYLSVTVCTEKCEWKTAVISLP